jgi:hypothetical protein
MACVASQNSPKYATAVGLLRYGAENKYKGEQLFKTNAGCSIFNKFFSSPYRLLNTFFKN